MHGSHAILVTYGVVVKTFHAFLKKNGSPFDLKVDSEVTAKPCVSHSKFHFSRELILTESEIHRRSWISVSEMMTCHLDSL
jgi:hypothetical protein